LQKDVAKKNLERCTEIILTILPPYKVTQIQLNFGYSLHVNKPRPM